MARETDPGIVLQVLLGRVAGKSNAEISEQIGYKRPGSISDLVSRYDLPGIENQIRVLLSGQMKEIPPAAVEMNAEYDRRLKGLGDKIYALTTGDTSSYNGTVSYRINNIKALEAAARALEAIRQGRLKAVTFNESLKPEEKEHEIKTSFKDLLDDNDDDNE